MQREEAMIMDGDAFYELVLADLKGEATDKQTEALRADDDSIREWKAVLTRMLQDADAKLSGIRAEINTRHQECIAAGPRAKSGYFRFKAGKERERADIVKQKAEIVERMKEVKDVLATYENGDFEARQKRIWDKLHAVESKLDRVLALLEGGGGVQR